MGWTATDITTLEDAIRNLKGARSIAFADQVITFESLNDMRELLAEMKRELAGTPRTRYATTRKGA